MRCLKTVLLLLWFMLISPLYAQPAYDLDSSPQDEDSPPAQELSDPDEGLFFFEELFVIEEAFFFSEETPSEEEPALSDTQPDPEGEDSPPAETSLSEETPSGEESSLSAPQPSPQGEGSPPAENPPGEETLLTEEPFIDDDDFFFEAPPLIFEVPTFEPRSFDTIFPNLSRIQRLTAMSSGGLRHSFGKDESPLLIPNPDLEIDLLGSVMKKNPSHLIEALVVVPYSEKEFDLMDIYNALGRIGKIKDYPAVVGGNNLYIFTESTRIESPRNRKAIPDPAPAVTLPFSQTMYLCLKEINFGNLFIRADISISMYGITYSMTNFTDVRYYLVPIMKAERFVTIIYLEPVNEGILIYSMSGFYLPGFIADRVNLTPNINRRIAIFINWITDGLKAQIAN